MFWVKRDVQNKQWVTC